MAYTDYNIFPLGDSAMTIHFGNLIEEKINKQIIQLFHAIQAAQVVGVTDIIPAYSSLTICYDIVAVTKHQAGTSAFATMKNKMENLLQREQHTTNQHTRQIQVPVCYADAFAPDKETMMRETHLSFDDIIQIHTSKTYTVYMLGFLPGFAYMGEVDARIAVARKTEPTNVAAGSVGIAGLQTGMYPVTSPGGWQIIGRTPLLLFDTEKEEPTLLQAGDEVQFFSIGEDEYNHY